ncbi:hypothetical protein [Streptomyces cinereoruber]|uniref:hypothetical protein n=1 Tax=Streptomyces cinereoruber TaxID=67260 RepID=UPI003C2B7619
MQYGTSRAGAVKVPLYRAADVDALPSTHPEADWEELRRVEKEPALAARRPAREGGGEGGAGTGVGVGPGR